MDKYTATEQAYKNGYERGIKEFAKNLTEHYFYDLERLAIFEEDIDNFVKKIISE